MGSQRWFVAPLRCYELGLQLKEALPIPSTPWLSQDREIAAIAEFIAAATCNSTNWDRLRRGIGDVAADVSRFSLRHLSSLSYRDFITGLGTAYDGNRNLTSRHRTIVDVALALLNGTSIDINALVSEPIELGGPGGLYDRLRLIPAFGDDPGEKKSRVLVQELCRTGLITPLDPGNVRPAIEYHLLRLYLRTERVSARRNADLERLTEGVVLPMPAITQLREAVEMAMYYTSDAAEIAVYDLNTIEWQIGRSLCVRNAPRCEGPPVSNKPLVDSVAQLVDAAGGRCPFATRCRARHDSELVRLTEPQLSRKYDYY